MIVKVGVALSRKERGEKWIKWTKKRIKLAKIAVTLQNCFVKRK